MYIGVRHAFRNKINNMDNQLISLLEELHLVSGDTISLAVLGLALACILIAWWSLDLLGLYMFQVVVLIAANIQVLRLSTSSFSPEPIALGTIIFATTYIAQDIITHHHGSTAAYRGVWVGFLAQLMFTVTMIASLAYAPLSEQDQNYQAMELLFVPSMRLAFSSLFAYLFSHMLNVRVFSHMRTYRRVPLWLCVSLSAWLATFVDHVCFSWFAWQALAASPVGWDKLWYTYIFPSFVPRVLIALLASPIIYLTYQWRSARNQYV